MTILSNVGSLADKLFSEGVSAWKDIEVAKAYTANDSRPATRDASGRIIPQGQDNLATTAAATFANPVLIAAAIAVAVAVVVYVVARRR